MKNYNIMVQNLKKNQQPVIKKNQVIILFSILFKNNKYKILIYINDTKKVISYFF